MSLLNVPQMALVLLAFLALTHAQTDSPGVTTELDVRLPPSVSGGPLGDENTLLQFFETGETMDLTCKASGVPEPEIDWYLNGNPVDLNKPNVELLSDGTLEIRAMTTLDEGEYHCTASNINGKAMSISAKLIKATLGRYPPTAEQTFRGDEGEDMMIPCLEVKSVPDATFSWALAQDADDNSPKGLSTSQRISISPKGHLFFANLQPEDERSNMLYKCNVFNPNLDITVGGSYAKIKVNRVTNVQNRPPVLQYPDAADNKVIAVLGDAFELKCIFSGRPAPKVEWKKVGGALPGGRFDDTLDDGTLLRITGVEWEDEAQYVCTGSNSEGSKTYTISVDVQSKPVFDSNPEHQMMNANVTQGQKAKFVCQADEMTEPSPRIDFLINAVALDDQYPGPRKSITRVDGKPGKVLSIENVCKDCVGGGTDLMGIQCRIQNDHGTIFKSVYLNVLLVTKIIEGPTDLELTEEYLEENTEVIFPCKAETDDGTALTITWFRDEKVIYPDRDERIKIDAENTLHIDISDLDDDGEQFAGTYTCEATNGYSNAEVEAKLTTPSGAGTAPVASAGVFDMWWIFIIIALILLLLILLLCCCLCIQRNKGDTYPVDEKERANGNDPEKELADSGFHDYQRPEDEPVKGSRASLTSTIKLDSDDEGSLNEYGDIDTGKFNEDGSFIGQYMNDKKKKKAFDSTV